MATTVDYILKVKTADAKKGLNETGKAAGVASKGLLAAAGSMAAVVTAGGILVAGMAAVTNSIINAAKAAVEFSQQSADLVNDINDLSNRSAIAADTIKGLQFALQASGQNASQATQLLSRFPSVLAQAEVETSRAALGFKNLGVKIKDANGNLRPANDIFLETATKLQSIEDQTLRSKMAFDIFGRSAGPLLQALGQTEGLKEFVAFTEKFGVRTGPKASDAAADFQVVTAGLDTVLKGLKSTFIETFGPSITDLIIKFGSQLAFLQSLMISLSSTISLVFTAAINTVAMVFNAFVKMIPQLIKGMVQAIPVIGNFARIILELAEPLARLAGLDKLFSNTFVSFSKKINQANADAKDFEEQLKALTKGGFKGFRIGTGGGGGGGGEGAPTTTGADFGGFVSGINAVVGELDNLEADLTSGINDMIASLEGLPELLEKSFRVSIAGSITEAIVAGVSGPSGLINLLGDAFSKLTMGLSGTIAGAIGGIARLGEKSPKEIRQDFMNFAKAFERGLKILPRVLIQVLPRFALAIITGFLDAIIKLPAIIADAFGEAFARIWESVKEFFKSIFTREGRQERRQNRRERRRAFFANLGESSQFYMSGGIMQAQSGARFTGRSRGLAMLHEGETVLPASGRAGQAEQRMMNQAGNGGGINIVINSAVVENRAIDELVRKLETRFGRFGVGKSTLFGR
jgi:hypothetical protein